MMGLVGGVGWMLGVAGEGKAGWTGAGQKAVGGWAQRDPEQVAVPELALAAPVRTEAEVLLKGAEEEKAGTARSGKGEIKGEMWFNGRLVRPVRTIRMRVTAYCPGACCCGKSDGITASGQSVWSHGLKLVAADTRILPFGTLVSVPGYNGGRPVPVLDRGGKIKGHRLDVLMPTHGAARAWGVRELEVTIWEYVD